VRRKAKKKKSATEIARDIANDVQDGISDRSVRRYIKDMGMAWLVIEKREELSPSQEKRRLDFAKKWKNHKWKYELFVDEKTFELGSSQHKCWQYPDDRITEEVKRHSKNLHVWGGIGAHFKTKLYFFTKNLDADLYCKILKKRLPPDFNYNLVPTERGNWIFVQDNDPKHKAKKTKELLDRIAPDRITDYPANSPDFNPMEDVWSILNSFIEGKSIKSITSLKKNLQNAWTNLDMEVVRRSVRSLPRRLEQCIKRKGKRTDY
jgi:hypothetical protein